MIRKATVWLMCVPILIYRACISPLFPPCCRFRPTCSEYAMEALAVHGAAKGLVLSVWRILRCNPLCRGGYDPVPEKGRWVSEKRNLFR